MIVQALIDVKKMDELALIAGLDISKTDAKKLNVFANLAANLSEQKEKEEIQRLKDAHSESLNLANEKFNKELNKLRKENANYQLLQDNHEQAMRFLKQAHQAECQLVKAYVSAKAFKEKDLRQREILFASISNIDACIKRIGKQSI
jgi:hypothetical protein